MNIEMTTELGAVNVLLQTINEAPVNSLEIPGLNDLSMARNVLAETSREFQSIGYEFNSDKITIAPDIDGYINLPANTARVDPVDKSKRYIQRGTRLYDKTENTFAIGAPVEVDIILYRDFNDLPEPAKRYITIKAARRFQNRVMGDDAIYMFTKEDELEAKVAFLEQEIDSGDYNMGRDSYTMQLALRRTW